MGRGLELGAVEVTVADLDRGLDYYTNAIGLRVLGREAGVARLGVPDLTIVVLRELPGAEPAPPEATGLSHFAPQLPDRADLAAFVAHYAGLGLEYQLVNHTVSHSIYITDPDGHGIEVTAPRPREEWEWTGDQPAVVAHPMELADFATDRPFTGLPGATERGHVQLKASDAGLVETEKFYCDLIGFSVEGRLGDMFLAIGATPHRALLVFARRFSPVGSGPAPEDTARLLGVDLLSSDVPGSAARLDGAGYPYRIEADTLLVDDPSGNPLRISPLAS